jgi:hypothetical protein
MAYTVTSGATVKLNVRNKQHTTLKTYTLSPGCTISHNIQKDNITFPIPLAPQMTLDLGFSVINTITINGTLTYGHDNNKPYLALEEMQNYTLFQATQSGLTASADGKWSLILEDMWCEPATMQTWYVLPKTITYDMELGGITTYTILLDVTQDDQT